MNVTKLVLDIKRAAVQNDLRHPYEIHRTLKRAFPDGEDEENRMLFRLEPRSGKSMPTILVQNSIQEPDWSSLPEDYCALVEGPRSYTPTFAVGQHLAFRLTANAVKKSKKFEEDEGQRSEKKEHTKHHRVALLDETEQQQWILRQGTKHGFRPLYVQMNDASVQALESEISEKNKTSIPIFGVRFDGLLEVTEPSALKQALEKGIGPAKAFGFGLLSLAPPLS